MSPGMGLRVYIEIVYNTHICCCTTAQGLTDLEGLGFTPPAGPQFCFPDGDVSLAGTKIALHFRSLMYVD